MNKYNATEKGLLELRDCYRFLFKNSNGGERRFHLEKLKQIRDKLKAMRGVK